MKAATNRLRVVRAEKRVTQEQIETKTKIAQTRISLIENGYGVPSDDEKKAIAKALTQLLKRPVPIQEVFPDQVTA